MLPEPEIERRVAELSQALRDSGLRLTRQRLETVRTIASTEEHPDVEAIFRGVRCSVPTVSIDTVYRTLATLTELGLVSRLTATPGPARYDANQAHHHHFVCERCGLVRDVESADLDSVRAPDETSEWGRVNSVEVNLRGVCRGCVERVET